MNGVTQARRDLAEALEASGLSVTDHVPSKLDPEAGAIVIEPAEDYLTRGETLRGNEVEVAVTLYVLVDYRGENDTAADALDEALVATYGAIPGSWLVTSTGKPGPQTNGEWTAYGIQITATTITDL